MSVQPHEVSVRVMISGAVLLLSNPIDCDMTSPERIRPNRRVSLGVADNVSPTLTMLCNGALYFVSGIGAEELFRPPQPTNATKTSATSSVRIICLTYLQKGATRKSRSILFRCVELGAKG